MRPLLLTALALLVAACSRPNPVFGAREDAGDNSGGGSSSNGNTATSGVRTTGAATATGASTTIGPGDTDMITGMDADTGPAKDVGGTASCVPESHGRRFELRIHDYADDGGCAGPMLTQSVLDLELVQGTNDEFVGRICPPGCNASCPTVAQGAPQVRLVVPPEMLSDFPPVGCVDVIAQVGPGDGCRVEYFVAWAGPADPKTGRGPADYVGVNDRADGAVELPASVPQHEFVRTDLCGNECPQVGEAVGEWALQFPEGPLVSHSTEQDAALISNDSRADYHVWNLQSYVSEECQRHRAWYGHRFAL